MTPRQSPDTPRPEATSNTAYTINQPEWPTLAVAALCYGGYTATAAYADDIGMGLTAIALTLCLTLHSSLQHEIIHGHPFNSRRLNDLLGLLPLGLFIPFERFRDTHLAHHHDPALTDPFDDPESNYIDPRQWSALPAGARTILLFNNTLLGRMLVGPGISLARLYRGDLRAIFMGDRCIQRAYLLHGMGLLALAAWLWSFSTLPWWLYLPCAYGAMSLLKIRTFLEHCAREQPAHRTVIVEDRGLLQLLFLNNNLHAVHHAHPSLPWYALPRVYRCRRSEFLRRNNHYVYRSYGAVIARYLFRRKDPVAHPHAVSRIVRESQPQCSASQHPAE